jgi:hypothetical protein
MPNGLPIPLLVGTAKRRVLWPKGRPHSSATPYESVYRRLEASGSFLEIDIPGQRVLIWAKVVGPVRIGVQAL